MSETAMVLATDRPTTIYHPDNWQQIQPMADALCQSTVVPKLYQGNHANCLIAIEMAHRLNMSPLQVMQNMYIVHGTPGWSAQFIAALINNSGLYDRLKYRYDGDGNARGCTAYARDRETGKMVEGTRVSMKMAKAEGWEGKSGSKWKTMPEQMLCYRAAAFFGRQHCPDVIMGMYAPDEVATFAEDRATKIPLPQKTDWDAYEREVADFRAALDSCPAKDIERIWQSIRVLMDKYGVRVDEVSQDKYEVARRQAGMDS